MEERFRNKYRIGSARLKGYDYSRGGYYFITICTKNRERFFGTLANGKMKPTPVGRTAEDYWMRIPEHFPFAQVDSFVLMPDHVHGILFFKNQSLLQQDTIPADDAPAVTIPKQKGASAGGIFGPQSNNLASVIRNYKGAVTSYAKHNGIPFQWHARFHDRIIRSPKGLAAARRYIENNPSKG
ncbi:MAG: hypothetical protein EOO15_21535 [Chitinophagaceae bacterium]|nr:MAG: hypothetical protein EOO15_21535 [Chitinophagaceae bacterium]